MCLNEGIELSNRGKVDKAIEVFKHDLTTDKLNYGLNFNLGVAYLKKDDYINSIKYLEIALGIDNKKECYIHLAKCYIYISNLDKATSYIEKSLEISTDYDSVNMLGVINFQKRNLEDAKSLFLKSLKLKKNNPDALYNLKDTYYELGDMKKYRESQALLNKLL